MANILKLCHNPKCDGVLTIRWSRPFVTGAQSWDSSIQSATNKNFSSAKCRQIFTSHKNAEPVALLPAGIQVATEL